MSNITPDTDSDVFRVTGVNAESEITDDKYA